MGYHRHCNRCNPINRLNEYIYYHNRLNRRIVRFKRSWDEIYKIIEEEIDKNLLFSENYTCFFSDTYLSMTTYIITIINLRFIYSSSHRNIIIYLIQISLNT